MSSKKVPMRLELPSAWEMGFKHGTIRAAVWGAVSAAYQEGRQFSVAELVRAGVLPQDLPYHPTSYFGPIKHQINRRLKDRNIPVMIIRARAPEHFVFAAV